CRWPAFSRNPECRNSGRFALGAGGLLLGQPPFACEYGRPRRLGVSCSVPGLGLVLPVCLLATIKTRLAGTVVPDSRRLRLDSCPEPADDRPPPGCHRHPW